MPATPACGRAPRAGQIARPERGEQVATGTEPRLDPPEERPELLARHMVEDVEGDDRVERPLVEPGLREVALEEGRIRNALPGAAHLLGGDVDPDQVRPLGEHPRRPDARAGAELEHVGTLAQQRKQLLEPLQAM